MKWEKCIGPGVGGRGGRGRVLELRGQEKPAASQVRPHPLPPFTSFSGFSQLPRPSLSPHLSLPLALGPSATHVHPHSAFALPCAPSVASPSSVQRQWLLPVLSTLSDFSQLPLTLEVASPSFTRTPHPSVDSLSSPKLSGFSQPPPPPHRSHWLLQALSPFRDFSQLPLT